MSTPNHGSNGIPQSGVADDLCLNGHALRFDQRFCGECGALRLGETGSVESPVPPTPPMPVQSGSETSAPVGNLAGQPIPSQTPAGSNGFVFASAPAPVARSGKALQLVALLAGFALVAGIAFGIGVLSQSGHIKTANQATAAAVAATDSVTAKLDASQQENSSLRSQAANDRAQLQACATATSLNVKMDAIQHKLINNALYFGSVVQWHLLQSRYATLGGEWLPAAKACDPSGGYSFK